MKRVFLEGLPPLQTSPLFVSDQPNLVSFGHTIQRYEQPGGYVSCSPIAPGEELGQVLDLDHLANLDLDVAEHLGEARGPLDRLFF
jgi:hypothetical protein